MYDQMEYNFDPSYMYQPQPPMVEYYDRGKLRFHMDGSVESMDDMWPLTKTVHNGYNMYEWKGYGFKAYKATAQEFWPEYPRELNCVDHINRCRQQDAFSNLRRVDSGLNNLNQYRTRVKGYRHETKEWLAKVNGYRVKTNQPPIILKEPPRGKYIAIITYKGKPYELGAFDTPEEATKCYVNQKEGFIQNQLRDIWTRFLAARRSQ